MRRNVGLIFGTSIFLTLAICCLTGAGFAEIAASEDNDVQMIIVWAESDGIRHEIFESSYRLGRWDEPVMITDDNAENIHPSIDMGSDGRKWAVWSAVEEGELEMRYSVFENEKWKKAMKLPSDLPSNIKPSIVVDDKNIPWVVWSGNNGDYDDIYYSQFIYGEWTEEKRVHSVNEVPDILPQLDTDENGFPNVKWDSYVDGSYTKFQASWDGEKWGDPISLLNVEDAQGETGDQLEVALPKFETDTRQVFLRVFAR